MSIPVIKVESLSKKFIIGQETTGKYTTLRDTAAKSVKRLFQGRNGNKISKEEYWALKDVNFEIKQGDRVGIIGRNGAGKSTLLKVLSRITDPTLGRVTIRGRVASLLEVGTGFHPELTGRENIFLNGAILGMSRSEIRSKFDEIVAFAEVEKFLDTAVKYYSSGMYVRLAFAVAAHLEPEILIVDEVLAVGDAEFQKKCLGKMQDVSNEGRTVIFVSHQMDAVLRLCDRAIYLKGGKCEAIGDTKTIIHQYLYGDKNISWIRTWENNEKPGNSNVVLNSVKVVNEAGESLQSYDIRTRIGITMEYQILKDNFEFTHGFNLFAEDGTHILTSHDVEFALGKNKLNKGKYSSTVWIPGNFLSENSYNVSVAIMSYNPFMVHFHEMDAVSFAIFDTTDQNSARGIYGGKMPGLIRPILSWTRQ